MLHLFKKVYLDFDDKINMSYDRIICSKSYGNIADSIELSRIFYGKKIANADSTDNLIGKNKPYNTFLDMLSSLDDLSDADTGPIYIYCDKESYYTLAVKWLKLILPFASSDSAWKFLKSHIFKQQNFANSRLSSTLRFTRNNHTWLMEESVFSSIWRDNTLSVEEHQTFIPFLQKNKSKISVEFLLAGYLYDKRYADELARSISPLVRKDLEKYLNEHKEIMLIHLQRPKLQELLGVINGPYTFDNFYDMPNDPSPLVQVLFKPEIWGDINVFMRNPSSKGSINFSAITDEDIENLIKYSEAACVAIFDQEGGGKTTYNHLHDEYDKFNFIKMLRDKDTLSIEDIDNIINYEVYHQTHSSGAFYAIDLGTVNTYFVDYLLNNYEDKSKLRSYIFEMPNET
jgi:hypothetical protein